jgi:integrase
MQDCDGRSCVVSEPTTSILRGVRSGFARRPPRDAGSASFQRRGPLFLSESRRNYTQPISIWSRSKVILGVARCARVERFSTHTLRHLCLTDLARAGWDIHEIAAFAGHRSIQTTLLYIHLSGRDLSAKLAASMAQIHVRRTQMLAEVSA